MTLEPAVVAIFPREDGYTWLCSCGRSAPFPAVRYPEFNALMGADAHLRIKHSEPRPPLRDEEKA